MIITSCAGFCLAQDVLVLKNGERIQDVFVSGKTNVEISYIQGEEVFSIPRDSVEAILHENGNIETVASDVLQDPQFSATIDSMGLDLSYIKQQVDRGIAIQNLSWILWQDEAYSQKCRNLGLNAFVVTHTKVYQEALKKAKKEGLKGAEAIEAAHKDASASKLPVKAGNEAVRECAGEL